MLGLEVGQVNEGEEFESSPSGQIGEKSRFRSLTFEKAKQKRKLVLTPVYIS
jgi:hypothetical protein